MNHQDNRGNARKFYGTLIELATKLIAELGISEKNPTKLAQDYLVPIRENTGITQSYVKDNHLYYSNEKLEIIEKEFIRKYSYLIHKKKRGKRPQKSN